MSTAVDSLLTGLFPSAPKPPPTITATGSEVAGAPGRGASPEALQHYRAAVRALAQEDWRTFGVEMEALRRVLEGTRP